MTFLAIFYDRHGHISAPNRVVPADDAAHLPDIILTVPGPITYDHDGHDRKGRQVYRERVTQ